MSIHMPTHYTHVYTHSCASSIQVRISLTSASSEGEKIRTPCGITAPCAMVHQAGIADGVMGNYTGIADGFLKTIMASPTACLAHVYGPCRTFDHPDQGRACLNRVSVCMSVHVSIRMSTHMSTRVSACTSIRISIHMSVHMSTRTPTRMSAHKSKHTWPRWQCESLM